MHRSKQMPLLVVLVAFLHVACDAAATDAREEACAAKHVKKQLVQTRTSLVEVVADDVENKKKSMCPWTMTKEEGGCHESPSEPKCANGNYSWNCIKDHGVERIQCPCFSPYMCKRNNCGSEQKEHCCEKSCESFDGMRDCDGKQEIEPTAEPVPEPSPTPAPPPKLADEGKDPKGPLKLCTGDCDSDAVCEGGLKCFQRHGYTHVPGCDGFGKEDYDYCYDPDLPNLPPLVDVDVAGKEDGLEACSGDCDKDSGCMPGLACFQRDGYTHVPGCSGKGTKDWDYCYKPVLNIVSKDPSAKLGECAGDCDKDSDCGTGLRCFERKGVEEVPGCPGEGPSTWDYCYKPPPLVDVDVNGKKGGLEVCSGDCDKDSDCMPGLACFQRSGTTLVPGCFGKGKTDWDYCYDKTKS